MLRLYIVTAHNCHISVKGSKTAGIGWKIITRAAYEVSQQTSAPSPWLTWVIVTVSAQLLRDIVSLSDTFFEVHYMERSDAWWSEQHTTIQSVPLRGNSTWLHADQ